jgi:anti-sigma regulatory factor (Ser/Thr protein kinase)
VQEGQSARAATEASVRFDADPAGVPAARHFVAATLRSWGLAGLVDDATLCASELAGNAALHSECSAIRVSVRRAEHSVCLSVEDDGPVPVALVAPRTTLPGLDTAFDDELDELDLLLADQPATGRGLAIVSVLAHDWGVEELPRGGKRVWAELREEIGATEHRNTQEAATASATAALPIGWVAVALPGCPTLLARRHEQHIDELTRELKLMMYAVDNHENVALARRLQPVLDASSYVQHSVRAQVDAAIAQGSEVADIQLALPAGFTSDLRRLDDALNEADELSDAGRLLAMPASVDIRAVRAWMNAQIIGQAERGATPVGWEDWQDQRG